MSGQLSLVPRSLGRGTDFACEDPDVIARGGVMVIQTFLSKECSEEIQIRGRCGRQGQPGKYRLFLRSGALENVGVSSATVRALETGAPDSRYKLLDEARNAYFRTEYGSVLGAVEEKKGSHLEALKFLHLLQQPDKVPAVEFILRENASTTSFRTGHARTLVLVDGTGSMGRTLEAAKVCISTMFDAVKSTLREHGVDENFFQLQFAVFRNYNSPMERLLQISGWESDSKMLSEFLKTVRAEGGSSWGEEAVEIALQHAASQISPELKQVLIIGDAPSQTLDQVKTSRGEMGEHYWTGKIGPPTTWEEQLNKIKKADPDLPIHAYWLSDWCRPFFEGLARSTAKAGSKSAFLETNSSKGAQVLRDTVAEAILATHEDSKALIATYRTNIAGKVHV